MGDVRWWMGDVEVLDDGCYWEVSVFVCYEVAGGSCHPPPATSQHPPSATFHQPPCTICHLPSSATFQHPQSTIRHLLLSAITISHPFFLFFFFSSFSYILVHTYQNAKTHSKHPLWRHSNITINKYFQCFELVTYMNAKTDKKDITRNMYCECF